MDGIGFNMNMDVLLGERKNKKYHTTTYILHPLPPLD